MCKGMVNRPVRIVAEDCHHMFCQQCLSKHPKKSCPTCKKVYKKTFHDLLIEQFLSDHGHASLSQEALWNIERDSIWTGMQVYRDGNEVKDPTYWLQAEKYMKDHPDPKEWTLCACRMICLQKTSIKNGNEYIACPRFACGFYRNITKKVSGKRKHPNPEGEGDTIEPKETSLQKLRKVLGVNAASLD